MKISTRLFLEQGYDRTTVDQIVECADLSQRTFFRYFPSKEAVLFRDFPGRERRLSELLSDDGANGAPFDRIRRAIGAMADDYSDDRESLLSEYRIVMQSPHLIALDVEQDWRLQKHFVTALREWNGKPYLSQQEAEIVAGAIFGSIRAAMGHWLESGCKADIDTVKCECLKVVDSVAGAFPGRT